MEAKNGEETDEPPEVPEETLRQELSESKKRNEELLTRLKYAQADLENYRKRTDKELKEAGESLARTLASKLLVVQDELDLAIKHSGAQADGELGEGLRMVQKNLKTVLESVGVERIDAVGTRFNPEVHEAVEKTQGDRAGYDMVVEEVRPGFTFRGQVLRPSMVKVELASKAPAREAKIGE